MKTCVVIPAYNEEKVIGEVVKRVRSKHLDVLVVDDGSKDNTSLIAEKCGAVVQRNDRNMGKGASLVKGFNYALGKGFDAVITMDGDGQHCAEDIENFLHSAVSCEGAIFIGDRMGQTKNMPVVRVLTNRFMSWLISCLVKQKVPDSQCGFRLIKRQVLEKIKIKTLKFEIESEMLIRAARLGFEIRSVPIKTIYSGEKSQINPFIDTLRFIKFIVRELWIMRS